MSDPLRNKLLGYEAVPPPAVWNKISEQLDKEFHSADASISARLEQSTATPPPGAWDNIASALQSEPLIIKRAPVVPLLFKRIAVAVVLATVVGVSVMYLFTVNTKNGTFAGTSSSTHNSAAQVYKPSTINAQQSVPSPATVIDQKPQPRLLPAQNIYNPALQESSAAGVDVSENNTDEAQVDDGNQDLAYLETFPTEVQTVQALKPVNIAAPLLRDANGHVIMDMKVITDGGNHYITVTSPNGTQTKISTKFLPCLSYLHGDQKDAISDEEGIECSEKFREWRNKLQSQTAYVPAANNFFDIFELQELIQD